MAKARAIYVDTGAWVALAVEDDAHHREAARVYPGLLKRRPITTNLRRVAGHKAAISFLEMLEAGPRIRKVYSTPKLEEEAFEMLKRFGDQDFSFTDAVSFVVMQKEGIEEAFAFDNRFRIMGFKLIP